MEVHKTTEENVSEKRSEEQLPSPDGDRNQVNQEINKSIKRGDTPLLLEDSTLQELPKYVENIFTQVDIRNTTENDFLAILTYCIALEAGFSLRNINNVEKIFPSFWGFSFHSTNVNILAKLPDKYCEIKDSIYNFQLKLLHYPEKNCLLICLRTGDSICITLTPEESPGKSICLSIARYVLSHKTKKIPAKFRNLKEFSFLLKEKIFSPIRNHLMDESAALYPGLTGMPTEILGLILRGLAIRDIQLLSKTCWKLRLACVDYCKKLNLPQPSSTISSRSNTSREQSVISIDFY